MKETDLSPPVTAYFESLGYVVNAEVKGCDLVARRGDYLIAVEMKKGFCTKLLFQAMDRQNFADEVYVAVLKPKRLTSDTAKIRRLAKVLDFGLLYVSLGAVPYVDVLHIPKERGYARSNKRKGSVAKEARGRSLELNKGGSARKKIATAYRERCMAIAAAMYGGGSFSPAELKAAYDTPVNTAAMLNRNYYGWFLKEANGRYSLKEAAVEELESGEFSEIFRLYRSKYER